MAELVVDIPLGKIPGLDPKTFEEEFVQYTYPNTKTPPLPPDPTPAEAATTQPNF